MIKLTITELDNMISDIIYIVGLSGICFIFFTRHRFSYIKATIRSMELYLSDKDFIRINYYVIINSKFYVKNHSEGKQKIIMKNGTVFQVSRRRWKNFKQYK